MVAFEPADEVVGMPKESAEVRLVVPAFEASEPENGVEID